ncbi:hypothetical protein [Terrimonas alba]|uniref:hypothetical protein n=1 Tax=Terrimonas alba TaxID=3349636 RepID=UPI0035F3E0B0
MCQIAKKNRIKTKVFGFNTDRKFFNQPASCNYTQSLVTCACNREKENWDLSETEKVTLIAGLAHVLSTVIIGILLGIIGIELSHTIEDFTRIIAPSIIILIGFYFIRQHYVHHHFHLQSRK